MTPAKAVAGRSESDKTPTGNACGSFSMDVYNENSLGRQSGVVLAGVAVVIASAVIPTLIAQRWFHPHVALPEENGNA
jgi:hypothetical protein